MLKFLAEFIGHFHPVIVHLPIGILLIAAFFYAWGVIKKEDSLSSALSIALLLGAISAAIACLTGWLLFVSGDYDSDLIAKHQWLGIATAIVSGICYLLQRKHKEYLHWLVALLVLLVTVTGHLGGTITHGEGFLTEAFNNYPAAGKIKPIENIQEALVYQDVIEPILATKCYGCHGQRKQKGGLRLDSKESILKGGKDGIVLKAGDAGGSELVQRIFLPHDNEDHMPPKEKPQPTAAQKDLIKWWIESGAAFDKKVRELDQPSNVKPLLTSLTKGEGEVAVASSVPEQTVDAASQKTIIALQKAGAVVVPVAQGSNYLSVNLVNADVSNDSLMTLLVSINKQLVWLKTGTYPVDEDAINKISALHSLTRLQISNLKDSKIDMNPLSSLKNLHYLNLSGAKLTGENVSAFASMTSLGNLYLFHSDISAADYLMLQKSLPTLAIDTGSYHVPTLASDTTELKEPMHR